MEALRKRQERIRFVQVRHEEAAALMACGYAKFTGKLGVCLATSGPGALHLLNGLYDAKLDQAPVLALTGLPYHDLLATHTQQDVEVDTPGFGITNSETRYYEHNGGPAYWGRRAESWRRRSASPVGLGQLDDAERHVRPGGVLPRQAL
jgi:glyoxylate carboligase